MVHHEFEFFESFLDRRSSVAEGNVFFLFSWTVCVGAAVRGYCRLTR